MVIKKNKLNQSISLIIIFVTFPALLSYGINNLALDYKVRSLTAAQAPIEEKDCLILTFQSDTKTRYVGAIFAHEDYNELHIYTKGQSDLFYLVYPIPSGYKELKYRLVVDGVYMKDPFNSLSTYEYDEGVDFSLIELSYQREKGIINPGMEGKNKVSIAYKGASGLQVNLIGDFNSWDPYSYSLQEDASIPGYYKISFLVRPGRHYYLFLINGKEAIDPNNAQRVYDGEARLLNYFDYSP